MSDMAPDDDFVRITLRIPSRLHQQLNDAAAKKRSMNAEIISRLEESFSESVSANLRISDRKIKNEYSMSIAEVAEKLLEAADLAKKIGGNLEISFAPSKPSSEDNS